MKKISILLVGLLFVGLNFLQAQSGNVSGTVTSSEDGMPIPGVSVIVTGTTSGITTDIDGKYTLNVPAEATTLTFSFVGMKSQVVEISGQSVIDVVLAPEIVGLDEVVVTALGIQREAKSLPYAAQEVDAEDVNVTSDMNLKNAIVGKVAGVQMRGQSGSKLGDAGNIRIRGAISLTSDDDPLYVIDGVPTTDPNMIDMENIASFNVLKGPNATALYGQRAENGVIMITSKKGASSGVTVEVNSSTMFDKVAYLPNYQNEYGGGYSGDDEWTTLDYAAGIRGYAYKEEWEVLDGQKYIYHGYADESWGPKFDGSEYIPWYAWWPDNGNNPYYGKTAKWEAQPDNIKNYYETGVTKKNSVAISAGSDRYNARVSYTNIDQSGIMPYTYFKKNMINANLSYKPTNKLTVDGGLNFYNSETRGDFDDGYSNQSTGSFNAWFNRNLDTDKLRELIDLKTTSGTHASWNYWNPYYGQRFGSDNGAFWFNPYWYAREYKDTDYKTKVMGNVNLSYKIIERLSVSAGMSTNIYNFKNHWEVPYSIEQAADPDLYNVWNSGFGNERTTQVENNYKARISYTDQLGPIDVQAHFGGEIRTNSKDLFKAEMDKDSKTQGLVLPDVFLYSNTKLPVTAETEVWNKEVRSLYGSISLGYKDLAFLDISGRKDWSSALPSNNNGYFYPSVGGSFIFSELVNSSVLSFGKLRASWAQVGNDVAATDIVSTYPLYDDSYYGTPMMVTPATAVDPNITPALNTSMEFGFDVNFLQNKLGLSFTYFNETREDEIVEVAMSEATGYTGYLTNAGASQRDGIEVSLNTVPVKTSKFVWDVTFNFSKLNVKVTELPGDLETMEGFEDEEAADDWAFISLTHALNKPWGQLRGIGIQTDANGNKIVNSETGMYATESGMFFGSVLPDFTGGILNSFTFFNMIDLTAALDFQVGGKFFSQSEMWMMYTGLSEETAGLNDKGNPLRDYVEDGGGIHVVGVDEGGNAFDDYVDSYSYLTQFNANTVASEFIHDASYIKLRDVNLSFRIPKSVLGKTFIKSASVGFVARNLWIGVAKDNKHGWDPSEMSHRWGENSQLPGTKSYGFNIKLTL